MNISVMRPRAALLLTALLLGVLVPVLRAPASVADPSTWSPVQPLERAHAHNDYEHARPLDDALDHGFTSVEADVWLVDGRLYIGHDAPDLTRTLRSLYLAPLARRVAANGGSVYPRWNGPFRLLIDVKSEATAAWPVIEQELARYPQLFTTYVDGRIVQRPVEAVISGNRDLAAMQAAKVRRSFYDGRLSDLDKGLSPGLVAWISDNWTNNFTWQGVGPMPADERRKLDAIVASAHAQGFEVRFWNTPDAALPNRAAVWSEEISAGVDLLNTDDLAGLQSFLLAHDPQEQ